MKHIILRLALVLIALAALAGGGYYVSTQEVRAAAAREGQRQFDDEAAHLQVALVDLRASQAAYLAPDQDPTAWSSRTAALLRDGNARLRRLAGAASGADIESDLATATESLATLERFDGRIRELLQDGQPLTAASLVFSDSAQLTVSASTAIAHARGARATATGSELARVRRLEIDAVAASSGVVALALLLLVPGRRDRTVGEEASEGVARPARQPFSDLTLHDLDAVSGVVRRAEPVPVVPAAAPPPSVAPEPASRFDLVAAARLCTDLARVQDTGELPALLARAAAVLDASGIVVWMAGPSGDLWRAFSYGYSPQALERMQSLPRDGETAVSIAFRKGSSEVVLAENEISGAIVVPIITPSRCVGVMAVEVPPGAETDVGEQALSNIFAAQLATLVAGESAP